MSKINEIMELREKRSAKYNAAQKYLEDHQKDGIMSGEDETVYNNMMDEVDQMGKGIQRLEAAERIDAELGKPTTNPLYGGNTDKDEKTGRASDKYSKAFWNIMRHGFRNTAGDAITTALQIGTDSKGGYLAPDEFDKTLVDALEENNIMRKLANVIRTDSGDHNIPVVASHGEAAYMGEGDIYADAPDTFGIKTLKAYKYGSMIKVSEELMNDSAFNMAQYIAKEFGRRMGRAEEQAFMVGAGTTSDPIHGIFTDAPAVSESAVALSFDAIMDLYYGVSAAYRSKGVFILNESTVKGLRKLKDSHNQYIWQPSVAAGTPDRLLGAPVYTSEFAPATAALFGDISNYWIGDRSARSFKRLDERYADQGMIGFLTSQRMDGVLVLPAAVKKLTLTT